MLNITGSLPDLSKVISNAINVATDVIITTLDDMEESEKNDLIHLFRYVFFFFLNQFLNLLLVKENKHDVFFILSFIKFVQSTSSHGISKSNY